MTTIVDIADSVTDFLNDQVFGGQTVAVRRLHPIFNLEDLKGLAVSVVPRTQAISVMSRDSTQHDHAIDIGVQKKLGEQPEAEIQALNDGEVQVMLDRLPFVSMPDAQWLSIVRDPLLIYEHLEQHRVFTTVLTVTYRTRSTRAS